MAEQASMTALGKWKSGLRRAVKDSNQNGSR